MNDILIPAIMFAGLALVAGLALSIFSKVFAVKVDERVEKVKEALPNLNCGACGFSGCEDYANKLIEDPSLACNLCLPGGADTGNAIAEILGKSFEEQEPIVAEVYCKGTNEHTKDLFEYEGLTSCSACNLYYAGKGACDFGCIGFGDCMKVCQYGAISIVDGIAIIDKDKCIGCGMCEKACPKGIIGTHKKAKKVVVKCSNCDMGKNTRTACKVGCIGCKKCEKICKFDAIHVVNNRAVIDYDKCKNCGMCVRECPIGCIIKM